jgi:tetratricopeptide (TPR) repeat protein
LREGKYEEARLAARRGNHAEAQAHAAKAKEILDRGANPAQGQFFPYLTGYLAFYAGDYKTALAELHKASQNDAFILSLTAQTYERLGDKARAMELYRKVASSTGHIPPAALSIPLAKKKLTSQVLTTP